ncbi:hypothetical protein BC567DRAFT_239613 [Phyllosticta citribraziliensis]
MHDDEDDDDDDDEKSEDDVSLHTKLAQTQGLLGARIRAICNKYEREAMHAQYEADEIDLETLEVVTDNGHLRGIQDWDDRVDDMEGQGEGEEEEEPQREEAAQKTASPVAAVAQRDEPTRRGWTAEEKALVVDLRDEQKLPFLAIAARFPGRSVATVIAKYHHLKKRGGSGGGTRMYRVWTTEEKSLLWNLRSQGCEFKAIAERLGRAVPQVVTRYRSLKREHSVRG